MDLPLRALRAHSQRWRLSTTIGALALGVLQFALVAVPSIDGAAFDEFARELRRTQTWRYGYVLQRHGAVLVKAARERESGPPPVIAGSDELAPVLLRELDERPRRAVGELLFYAGLLALSRWLRCAWSSITRGAVSAVVRAVTAAALAGAFVACAMSPYLLVGYGEPLFSTWRGPGALSWSGTVSVSAPVVPSVSYRMFLEGLLIHPLMALELTGAQSPNVRFFLTTVATVFWGALAGLAAVLSVRPERCPRRSPAAAPAPGRQGETADSPHRVRTRTSDRSSR